MTPGAINSRLARVIWRRASSRGAAKG